MREAGLDGDRLAKILAADFRLAALILEGAETIEREQRSRGRLEKELAQAPDALGVVGFRANPDVDRAVPTENKRSHVAENRGVGEAGDLVHVQAGASGSDRIDPQGEGWARHDHPVEDVDHAVHVLHHAGDLPGLRLQHGLIRGEDLHLDRGGRPGEVTDQIVQDAGELDVENGLRGVNLSPDLVRDLLHGSPTIAPQLDEEIAGIGLADGEREACPRPPGIALDLRGLLQDLLHLQEGAVGLGE